MMKTIDFPYILGPLFILYLILVSGKIKKEEKKYSGFQYITLITFGIYILAVIALTIFPLDINLGIYRNLAPWYSQINIIPIITIDLMTFILNIVMLMPYGIYQYLLSKGKKISWGYVARKSFIFSMLIEISQLLIYITVRSGRSVDINDLIANTLGGIIGYYILNCILKNEFFGKLINKFKLTK